MIPFLDLHKINTRFRDEIREGFEAFFNSGSYILGEQVSKFENEFAQYCGAKHCIGVSNGLDAIKLILEAYKTIGQLNVGDEIIVPANTYIASVLAVSNCGFKAIPVEPELGTFNINPNNILKHISKKTKAILGVHLYGQLYDVIQLEEICKTYNLILIEDAAQAHGAIGVDGRRAGNVSNAAAFSFYPTKNLGALGDGGAITTNSQELDGVIRRLRNYGRTSAYINEVKGFNCRLDEIQAMFLRSKLKSLDEDNNIRRNIARYYLNNIKSDKIELPECNDINSHVFHLFVIRHSFRDNLKAHLKNKCIETSIHYPVPIHKQKAYAEWNGLSLPITEKIHNEVLSIPINPLLNSKQIGTIVNELNNC
ncbi:DegT/DnrJ/EryC1/StrS family aminotransferase [uncultured Algibacter sp.]|uniref:DegT/DnrJ/EryC1/StrS family aminotransferase n=1 Tax=uncultured Algibacter sp. TaxID=298659 RepID=UPI00262AD300|nr:DegT/DnrJ/EryC1/StrS family aminotransferase [uncultured Algibacter sp.]